jgi:hypothetical protein
VGFGGTVTGVGSAVGWGVADGLGLAGVAAAVWLAAAGMIDGDAVGVTSGAGVAADVQAAAMSRPTVAVVASRECDECIPCPSGRCTSGDVRERQLLRS